MNCDTLCSGFPGISRFQVWDGFSAVGCGLSHLLFTNHVVVRDSIPAAEVVTGSCCWLNFDKFIKFLKVLED